MKRLYLVSFSYSFDDIDGVAYVLGILRMTRNQEDFLLY